MCRSCCVVILFFCAVNMMTSQVGVGTTRPDLSAILELKSTKGGLLMPRVVFGQKMAIFNPENSLLVYQTDHVKGFYYYTSNGWKGLLDKHLAVKDQYLSADRAIYTNFNDLSVDGETLFIDASADRIGLGTSSPHSKLEISGTGHGLALLRFSLDRPWVFEQLGSGADSKLRLRALVNEKRFLFTSKSRKICMDIRVSKDRLNHNRILMVEHGGKFGIKTTNPTFDLTVNGTAGKTGGGQWLGFSDYRVKKNIVPFCDGLKQLIQIQPKTFEYNGKGGTTAGAKTHYGVIAQEVQKIAPYMVETHHDQEVENLLSYDSTALTYIMVNAVQEQQHKLEIIQLRTEKAKTLLAEIAP